MSQDKSSLPKIDEIPDMDNQGLPEKQAPSLKRILKVLIPILISVVLVIWVYHSIEDPAAVWRYVQQATLWPLLLMIPLSLLSHYLRAWRWRRFIGEKVSVFYGFTSVMIGYAVNDVLPRVGEIARVINMNRMTRVPIAKLLTTLLAERIIDVIVIVLLVGVSILIQGEVIAETIPDLIPAGKIALAFAIIGLIGLFFIAFAPDLICRIFNKIAVPIHAKAAEKGEALIRQGADGLAFLKKPSQAFPVFLETVGIWGLYLVTFLLGLEAFGILDDVGYDGGTVSFSITCSGVIVPSVGAIGAYHKMGQLSLINLLNIDADLASACILVIHAILFYFIGGVCGVIAWGLQIFVRRKKTDADTPDPRDDFNAESE